MTYVDKVCVVICDYQNRVRSMWGDGTGPDKHLQTVAFFSLASGFILTLSKFWSMGPPPHRLNDRYFQSIYHYSVEGGGAGPDKNLQIVAFFSLALGFIQTLSKI